MAGLWDEDSLFSVLERAHAAGDSVAAQEAARRIKLIRDQKVANAEEYNPASTPDSSFIDKLKNPVRVGLAAVNPASLLMSDNAFAGFGKSFVDTKDGISQLLGVADDEKIRERRKLDGPLMKTGDGAAGYIGGQVAQIAIPGGAISKAGMIPKVLQGAGALPSMARAAVGGGVFSAATQPVLDEESRLKNAGVGAAFGAAGAGIPAALGALGKAGSSVSKETRELALKAQSMGIPVTSAQLSDSRFVKVLFNVVKQMPLNGLSKIGDAQKTGFNRAVARTFGENADAITPEVALRAMNRMRAGFDDVTSRNSLKVDSQMLSDLASIGDDAAKTATSDNSKAVSNLIDEVLSKTENGVIDGKAYRQLDSKIGRLLKTRDGDRAYLLGQLRDTIRSGMDRSISPKDSAAWKKLRGQYKNLKTVEDLIEKAPTGDISPALLLNQVRRANKNMAYGGGGDLADLARIGQRFLKDPIQNSTTAEKMAAMGMLGGGIAGGSALGIDPTSMLALLAAGMVGGKALGSNASARYLLEGSPALRTAGQLTRPLPLLLPAAANTP